MNESAPPGEEGGSMSRVLVAPLNWGLGHVARCIPLIRTLEQMGTEVMLASDGAAFRLLKAEFPDLPAFKLPSYHIRYDSRNMVMNIARQLPRLLYAIRTEQWATERLVKEYGIQGIISDNRYGCFSKKANSVLLTHQLHLRVPNRVLEWSANRVLRRALRQFDTIWVPDAPDATGLSGVLSHPAPTGLKTHYIGILSRMRSYPQEPEYDVAVVLSGPEPQRSVLEQRLLEQAMALPQKFIFIRGKTQAKEHYYAADNVEVVSYLTAAELNEVLLASKVLVCRSGYSSIMDLAVLGKKALLIPTPGQTEQEYLAEYFAGDNTFLVQKQEDIDMKAGLKAVGATSGLDPETVRTDAFEEVLRRWVGGILS